MEGKGEPGDSFTLSLPLPLLLVVANYFSSVSPTQALSPGTPTPQQLPDVLQGRSGGGGWGGGDAGLRRERVDGGEGATWPAKRR